MTISSTGASVVSGATVSPGVVSSVEPSVVSSVAGSVDDVSSFLLQAVAISPRLMTAAARNRPVRPDDDVVRTCFPPYVLNVNPEALRVTPITPR